MSNQTDIVEDLEEIEKALNGTAGVSWAIIASEAAAEITRLRAENEKLREELEEMREACQANYMLGVERGKEDARDIAAATIRESGDE